MHHVFPFSSGIMKILLQCSYRQVQKSIRTACIEYAYSLKLRTFLLALFSYGKIVLVLCVSVIEGP
jgi:hypothetical protein